MKCQCAGGEAREASILTLYLKQGGDRKRKKNQAALRARRGGARPSRKTRARRASSGKSTVAANDAYGVNIDNQAGIQQQHHRHGVARRHCLK